jgi:glycosyltransferase involved in cell wall biosynthesis
LNIAILSSFYPYRGGIAQFNENLYNELSKDYSVQAFNFSRQYPGLLFPGKTQLVSDDDKTSFIPSIPVLDSANPLTYGKAVRAIRAWSPDLLILPYWMSYFAPSLGYVARHLQKQCKVIGLLHNVIPHEPKFFDAPATKYFLKGCDGTVTLSKEVEDELLTLRPTARNKVLFHPIYANFGDRIPRTEAEDALGIRHGMKNLLFFGLIREYKGLDILLRAFSQLDESYQLIVAGEPYVSFDKYQEIVDSSPAKDRIHLFVHFIEDSQVKTFFSAADLVVLPYRSATQSGVCAIAWQFGTPMVVTDKGALKEIVGGSGTGLVADDEKEENIVAKIHEYFSDPSLQAAIAAALKEQKEKLSWKSFAKGLMDFAKSLNK